MNRTLQLFKNIKFNVKNLANETKLNSNLIGIKNYTLTKNYQHMTIRNLHKRRVLRRVPSKSTHSKPTPSKPIPPNNYGRTVDEFGDLLAYFFLCFGSVALGKYILND